MLFEQIKELVLSRQSCREFNDKPILEEDIKEILDLARFTPSACNSQPWEMFYVIKQEDLAKVKQCLQDNNRNPFLDKAKAFVILCEKNAMLKPGSELKFNNNHFVKYDIGELVAYITLIAKSKGIESCIIGWVNKEKIAQITNSNDEANIVIALGYSDIPNRKKIRKEYKDVVKSI